MERNEKEVANDIAGNAELQGKGCDVPLKLEGHNVFESQMMCASLRSDWPESSTHDYIGTSRIEDRDSSTCVIALAGFVPPQTSACSLNDVGNVLELTEGNYRTRNISLVSSPLDNRQGKWQHHLSELPCESVLKNLQGVQDTQEISACLRTNEKRIISSCNVNMPNNLATSSSPQLLVDETLKLKGAFGQNEDAEAGFCSAARKVASDALMRSSANSNQLSLHRIEEAIPESLHRGITLREWLKHGHCKRDQVESLLIYRQIVELVDSAHSQGVALQDLRPSCFNLLPSNRIVYTGSSAKKEWKAAVFHDVLKKRPVEKDTGPYGSSVTKQQKLSEEFTSFGRQSQFATSCGFRIMTDETNLCANGAQASRNVGPHSQCHSNYPSSYMTTKQRTLSLALQLEEKWYRSPEQLNGGFVTFSSNIYSLGVLLFELLTWYESPETHSTVMLDLHRRILPSNFLSTYPKEAGFCLWFLHPEPSSRPTASEILQSELICQSQEWCSGNDVSTCRDNNDAESEMSLHFLNLLKEQKQMHATKLIEHIGWLEDDIKEVEKRHFLRISSQTDARDQGLHLGTRSAAISGSFSVTNMNEERSMRNISQIDNAYFSMRSRLHSSASASRSDKDFFKNQDRLSAFHNEKKESNMIQKPADPLGAFFDGLCKFARYSKFEVCGSLKNGHLLGSTNVLCSLSFDRDEEYIAAAGVSKKIKVFEFGTLLNDSMDIHYPVVEMSNNSKLSCVCWNNHIKNYLASTDYDGVIQMWDVGTGQGFSQYTEHQKRAWSVDFSLADPMMFASGSDDCSVRLWSINERGSIGTISNQANVCCVQFSASSSHFVVFGSADYKIYCYDLRHTRIPWCTLAGHEKAVSYVKFLDSETLVSASTDNTLKLWDLDKTSSNGLSSGACRLTFGGHTNKKNFVGLCTLDGYIACGSETNEVYCYYRSLPMPITSYKCGYDDSISGNKIVEDNGQFVSSVCWRQKSNMVVAANSMGKMEVLKMV